MWNYSDHYSKQDTWSWKIGGERKRKSFQRPTAFFLHGDRAKIIACGKTVDIGGAIPYINCGGSRANFCYIGLGYLVPGGKCWNYAARISDERPLDLIDHMYCTVLLSLRKHLQYRQHAAFCSVRMRSKYRTDSSSHIGVSLFISRSPKNSWKKHARSFSSGWLDRIDLNRFLAEKEPNPKELFEIQTNRTWCLPHVRYAVTLMLLPVTMQRLPRGLPNLSSHKLDSFPKSIFHFVKLVFFSLACRVFNVLEKKHKSHKSPPEKNKHVE